MTNLQAIYADIIKAPTMMSLLMEKEFCRRLMASSPSQFDQHWSLASKIFERLCESHTAAIYEMRSLEETAFFVNWLRQMAARESTSERRAELASVAETFSSLP